MKTTALVKRGERRKDVSGSAPAPMGDQKATRTRPHAGSARDEAGEVYWTAKEAAAYLGVKVDTLYVYVVRKQIPSQRLPGSREHRYLRSDIRRLGKTVSKSQPVKGDLVAESAITLLTEENLYYRGCSVRDLAETETLEAVAALLWDFPIDVFNAPAPGGGDVISPILQVLSPEPASARAMVALPIMEGVNPRSFIFSPEASARTGVDVMRWLTAIILGEPVASADPIHVQFARSLGLNPVHEDLLRRFLILSADHGFEEGTYAVRAIASTGVTLWRSVSTGIAVATGRSSKFGRSDAVWRMVVEAIRSDEPEQCILRRIHDGEPLPGFWTVGPQKYDPRATALLEFCDRALSDDEGYLRLKRALAVAYDFNGLAPHFTLVGCFASLTLGLNNTRKPRNMGADAPLLIGRSAGWIAHAREQYALGETERRPVIYRGPLPK